MTRSNIGRNIQVIKVKWQKKYRFQKKRAKAPGRIILPGAIFVAERNAAAAEKEMAMKTLGYYNGRYDEIENMMIPMNDRVHWFGDGVYDAGPCRNYHIFAIDELVDRFFNSAALMDIKMPVTKDALKDLLNELVKKMDTGKLFVYYQVTREAPQTGTTPLIPRSPQTCG